MKCEINLVPNAAFAENLDQFDKTQCRLKVFTDRTYGFKSEFINLSFQDKNTPNAFVGTGLNRNQANELMYILKAYITEMDLDSTND